MPVYNQAMSEYVNKLFATEDEVTARIRKQIPERGLPAIMITAEEAVFLQWAVAASRARLALEIGTLGGYSGTWIARALPRDGRLITLEMNPEHARVARSHFELGGVSDRVDIRLGNAHDLLPALAEEGPFDFVFIDAEKQGYPAYLDWTLANLSPGGVLAAHNAFRHGAVADPDTSDAAVLAMQSFNQRLAEAESLISTIFPAGDGTAIAVRKP